MAAPALEKLEDVLRGLCLDIGGYADIDGVYGPSCASFPRAISIGYAYQPEDLEGLEGGPTPAYYRAYGRLNTALNHAVAAVAECVKDRGYEALGCAATVSPEELDALGVELTAAVQHKTAATRAGLGWIGRSGLLVTKRYGPRIRLATVLTDMPLPTGNPVTQSRCGRCRRCVDACPAQAIQGALWSVGTARDDLVDVTRCAEVAERLMAERVGQVEAVCGVCMSVCPFGSAYGRRHDRP